MTKKKKKADSGPLSVVGYTRVSTAGQADEGHSLEAQRASIERWASGPGYVMLGMYTDEGISGTKSDRPGLHKALDQVCKEKGVLVVYSLSRLARSTRDAIDISERLHKCGADLVSLSENIDTTTATGKMIFRLLAVLAEFERDVISDRTKAALTHLRAQGRRNSRHAPYGFRHTRKGDLESVESEQEALRLMCSLRGEGVTFQGISDRLAAAGHLNRTGKPWDCGALKRIIDRNAAAEV